MKSFSVAQKQEKLLMRSLRVTRHPGAVDHQGSEMDAEGELEASGEDKYHTKDWMAEETKERMKYERINTYKIIIAYDSDAVALDPRNQQITMEEGDQEQIKVLMLTKLDAWGWLVSWLVDWLVG